MHVVLGIAGKATVFLNQYLTIIFMQEMPFIKSLFIGTVCMPSSSTEVDTFMAVLHLLLCCILR